MTILAERIKKLRAERGLSLLDAKRVALSEDASLAASFALEKLHDHLTGETVELIDMLIKARVSEFPR